MATHSLLISQTQLCLNISDTYICKYHHGNSFIFENQNKSKISFKYFRHKERASTLIVQTEMTTSATPSSSVIVVEIDTRKGPSRTVFESSVQNQTEPARQFWKTLTLPPHIESSLYSKEINQQLKANRLKPICNLFAFFLEIKILNILTFPCFCFSY